LALHLLLDALLLPNQYHEGAKEKKDCCQKWNSRSRPQRTTRAKKGRTRHQRRRRPRDGVSTRLRDESSPPTSENRASSDPCASPAGLTVTVRSNPTCRLRLQLALSLSAPLVFQLQQG
jgi:hypothetical protein